MATSKCFVDGQLKRLDFGSWGDFTDETIRILTEESFDAGIANIQEPISLPVDPYSVPRLLVRNWSEQQFAGWLAKTNLRMVPLQSTRAESSQI